MKLQLSILLASVKAHYPVWVGVLLTYFMPITGMLGAVLFAILLDTFTGVWKAVKTKVPLTSRKMSQIVSKLFLYEVTIILFFLIDNYILNDILKQFFSVDLLTTKLLTLVLLSIEVISINENYKAVKGIDLWASMKNLVSRVKEIKKDIDETRPDKDNPGEAG